MSNKIYQELKEQEVMIRINHPTFDSYDIDRIIDGRATIKQIYQEINFRVRKDYTDKDLLALWFKQINTVLNEVEELALIRWLELKYIKTDRLILQYPQATPKYLFESVIGLYSLEAALAKKEATYEPNHRFTDEEILYLMNIPLEYLTEKEVDAIEDDILSFDKEVPNILKEHPDFNEDEALDVVTKYKTVREVYEKLGAIQRSKYSKREIEVLLNLYGGTLSLEEEEEINDYCRLKEMEVLKLKAKYPVLRERLAWHVAFGNMTLKKALRLTKRKDKPLRRVRFLNYIPSAFILEEEYERWLMHQDNIGRKRKKLEEKYPFFEYFDIDDITMRGLSARKVKRNYGKRQVLLKKHRWLKSEYAHKVILKSMSMDEVYFIYKAEIARLKEEYCNLTEDDFLEFYLRGGLIEDFLLDKNYISK